MDSAAVWFVGIACAVAVGMLAHSRNRSGIGWAFLSLLITPPLAFVLVVCLPANKPRRGRLRTY